MVKARKKGERVLDPFSGSMTTDRTAWRYGLRSLSLDLHREYCELGLKLLEQEVADADNLAQAALPLDFPQQTRGGSVPPLENRSIRRRPI
jgi:DNA modification methylase